jgi:hypothetical protein
MKILKIGLIIIVLFVLCIPTWFIYTRFCLDIYKMNGNTLTYNNSVYVRKDSLSASDQENLGKTIGIAIDGKRSVTDYIWPFWVMDYKNDKKHNRIFVRGLMDFGTMYEKDTK